MLQKNDEFELEITDMSTDGEGIGRYEGMTFFVNGAVTGDRILAGVTRLKKTYGYARIVKIIEASPDRVEPLCPLAKRCGGCQLQHVSYAKQLTYKENKVRNNLIRLGGIKDDGSVIFHKILGMEEPWHYRNKGQFPVGQDKTGRVISGFYAGHSHAIVESENCPIQHVITDKIMAAVREYMKETGVSAYDEEYAAAKGTKGAGLVRHVLTRVGFVTHEVMVCVVINGKKLPSSEKLTEKLQDCFADSEYELKSVMLNINTENTNVVLGDTCRTLFGESFITDYIGDIRYRISPLSFFQVNPVQTRKLYSTALEYANLTDNEVVWDLYCGIGTISLFLAQNAKQVYGVEIVPQAIDDARKNAELNEITNAEFFVGAAEDVLPAKYAADPSMRADVIVVDPPRKGCDAALLDCIAGLEPKRIVYVSCDSATLARDVKILSEKGYELKEVTPCDMFPQSSHVETVVLMTRTK